MARQRLPRNVDTYRAILKDKDAGLSWNELQAKHHVPRAIVWEAIKWSKNQETKPEILEPWLVTSKDEPPFIDADHEKVLSHYQKLTALGSRHVQLWKPCKVKVSISVDGSNGSSP